MLVLDDTETRHGAAPHPSHRVLRNGTFGSATVTCSGDGFTAGEEFDGWIMSAPLRRRTPVIQLCSPELIALHPAEGHLAVLSGTMSQRLITEPGESYRLTYDSLDVPLEPKAFSNGAIGDVLIDGHVVQTFVTAPGAAFVSHQAFFIARSVRTTLSFTPFGRIPFALSNVSATKVDRVVCCERDMLESLFRS